MNPDYHVISLVARDQYDREGQRELSRAAAARHAQLVALAAARAERRAPSPASVVRVSLARLIGRWATAGRSPRPGSATAGHDARC